MVRGYGQPSVSYSPEYGSWIWTTTCELQSRVWFVDMDNHVSATVQSMVRGYGQPSVSYSPEYGSWIWTTTCELQSRVWFVDMDNQV